MPGIETRLGQRAAQWLLDAVMLRRLPLWQRILLAILLVLLFVVPPAAMIITLAVLGVSKEQPLMLLLSAVLAGLTAWFWWSELWKYRRRHKK